MLSLLKAVLTELLTILKLTATLLRVIVWSLTVRPKGFGVRVQIDEEWTGMAKLFTYRQGLLPVPIGVASQRLVVTVNGVAQEPLPITADADVVQFKAGPEGATVGLSLDYIDSAGNDSTNFEAEFVIVDGVAPDAPTGFGELAQIGEEDDGT